jgi:hypothetical protein
LENVTTLVQQELASPQLFNLGYTMLAMRHLPDDPPPVEPLFIKPPWDMLVDKPRESVCKPCQAQLKNLHQFLALPLLQLEAAVCHTATKETRVLVAVGLKSQVRLQELRGNVFQCRINMVHLGVLNHPQSDKQTVAILDRWAEWSRSVRHVDRCESQVSEEPPDRTVNVLVGVQAQCHST